MACSALSFTEGLQASFILDDPTAAFDSCCFACSESVFPSIVQHFAPSQIPAPSNEAAALAAETGGDAFVTDCRVLGGAVALAAVRQK